MRVFSVLFLTVALTSQALAQQTDPRVCVAALDSAETDNKNLISNLHKLGAVAAICEQDKAAMQKQLDELKAKYEPVKKDEK